MTVWSYGYKILLALDQVGNAVLNGNPKQTISARAYEGGELQQLWQWKIAYYTIDGVAYGLRWTIGRAMGFRFGVDMPRDHCANAYNPLERTYPNVGSHP